MNLAHSLLSSTAEMGGAHQQDASPRGDLVVVPAPQLAAAVVASSDDIEHAVRDPPPLNLHSSFVVPPQHRPSLGRRRAAPTDHIPVIDLAPLWTPPATDAAAPPLLLLADLATQVGSACSEWGFFQVINHGIPDGLIQRMKAEAAAFFHLPLHKKLEVKRTSENPLGYNDGELTKNVRDWKEVFDMAASGSFQVPVHCDEDEPVGEDEVVVHPNQWPSSMPGLRKACEEYISAVEALAFTLLELIAQSLGLPPRRFQEDFKSSGTSVFRLNHYPVCPIPELALGVSRHKDQGALTILLQDGIEGLEVRGKDGNWFSLEPNPRAFVINVGDIMEVYSNNKYQSVEHRVVVNKNTDRYSFPLFFNPAHWVDLAPVPELIDDKHPPQYRPFNWGKYFKRRNDSNYENLGVENLQISDYSINIMVKDEVYACV